MRAEQFDVPSKTAHFLVHIVDDDEAVRKGLSRLMRSAGVESLAYDSPENFLAQVQNVEHACVVLDITMPRMNGLELLCRLNSRGIRLPVIAVSARDDDETRQLARDLGVSLFLRKPVDDQALLDAIAWVVDARSTTRGVTAAGGT
jgi:FixJ family two-component response regulator